MTDEMFLAECRRVVASCENKGLIKRTHSNAGTYYHKKEMKVFTPEHRAKLRAARQRVIEAKKAIAA